MKKALFAVLAFAMFTATVSSSTLQANPGPFPECYPGDTCIASVSVPGPFPECYPGDTCVVENPTSAPPPSPNS